MAGGSTVKEMTTNFGKLDKFEGYDFRSWQDFKHSLKHGKDDMSLVQLGSHLRTKESLRAQESDKSKGKEVVGPSMNMMEEGGKNKNNKQNKGKKCGFKDKNGGSGIIHEITAPYTPQQNDVAEKKNIALKEMVNAMLSYSGLSDGFLEKAMLRACYLLNKVHYKRNKTTPYELCVEEDPRTYNEAMQSRDVAFWKEAIDDEIGSILKNNTWVVSDLPPGCKPLGCKWIFKRKMKVDGSIDKFRLDCREDYSPMSTPIDHVKKLMPNTSKHVDQLEYSRAIGCLMYDMTSTRPDIAYAVGRLSKFTSNSSR
nr:zinc finger, CCHC-type [Tanacetum cinerariifolium]